jgi:hypothetical protein
MDAFSNTGRSLGEFGDKRGGELDLRSSDSGTKAKFGGRSRKASEEQTRCFLLGQPGQTGPEAVEQAVTAPRAVISKKRDARRPQRSGVSVDR